MPVDSPMVLVPREPTEAMLHAADMKAMFVRGETDLPRALWDAMLSASPARGEGDAPVAWRVLQEDLIDIVEGIGVIPHGTWRDEKDQRLKDTPQWAAFYVAARRRPTPATSTAEQVGEPTRLQMAVAEFLSDWRKGDFDLPRLAELDAEAMESALQAKGLVSADTSRSVPVGLLVGALKELIEVVQYDPADLPSHEYEAVRSEALAKAMAAVSLAGGGDA